MYSVYFNDLKKVIEVLNNKVPNLKTFCSIEGNSHGDFVIHDENAFNEADTWIVRHDDFSVWHLEKGKNKWGDWVEVE